jgi:phosphatidylinositol 4-kinase A
VDPRLQTVPLRNIGGLHVDFTSKFMADLAKRQRWRYAQNIIEATSIFVHEGDSPPDSTTKKNLLDRLTDIELRAQRGERVPEKELHDSFIWAGTHLYASSADEFLLVRKLVSIPFRMFTAKVMEFGVSIWVWISRARPSVHNRLCSEIVKHWEWTVRRKKGLFNPALQYPPAG